MLSNFCIYGIKAYLIGSIPKSFSICKQYSWIQHQIYSQKIYVNLECAITLENKKIAKKVKLTLMKEQRILLRELGGHHRKSNSETRSASTHTSRNGKVLMKTKPVFLSMAPHMLTNTVAQSQNPNPNLAVIQPSGSSFKLFLSVLSILYFTFVMYISV